jgi:hypothetical protein
VWPAAGSSHGERSTPFSPIMSTSERSTQGHPPSWAAGADHRTTALEDGRPGKGACSPLLGKIFDEARNRLTPSHAVKNRRRYRYYASGRLVIGTSQDKLDGWRLPAPQIEKLVADEAIRALDHRRFAAGAFDELDSDDGIWEVES